MGLTNTTCLELGCIVYLICYKIVIWSAKSTSDE